MQIVLMISSTFEPRLKSFTGLLKLSIIGPIAVYPPSRETSLYPILPAFKSGNTNTLALPPTSDITPFFLAVA